MQNNSELLSKTKIFLKQHLPIDATGHDWLHSFRVNKIAREIAIAEGGDLLIVELSSLLHDIGDWKFSGNNDNGASIAKDFLTSSGLGSQSVKHICSIIEHISFKGAYVTDSMSSLEGQIVQDADRLDAMGAIGIARAFAYGGFKGQPIYDPDIYPTLHSSFEEYKNHKGTSINHFYEKLVLLKDKMNTNHGKALACHKHELILKFLDEFRKEVKA